MDDDASCDASSAKDVRALYVENMSTLAWSKVTQVSKTPLDQQNIYVGEEVPLDLHLSTYW